MSTPNSRFQPAMRGVASAKELTAQADELRAQAAVQAIQDAEFERVALRNGFMEASNANQNAARDLSADLKVQVYDFLKRCSHIIGAGDTLRSVVPYPRAQITGYVNQRAYNRALIDAGFAAQADIVAKTLDGAPAAANAIVNQAWSEAVPSAPDRALQNAVDLCVLDIRTALGAGSDPTATAERVLSAAIAENDNTMIFALLGSPSRRLLTAMGVDRLALVKSWAQGRLAAAPLDANGVAPLSGTIQGAQFLTLQLANGGAQGLAALPGLARKYYASRLDEAKQLLASSTVQANLR